MLFGSRNASRHQRLRCVLAVCAAMAGFNCGAPDVATENFQSKRLPIADGTENQALTAVFSLQVRYASASRRCTALLVAPNLFLTARHCLIADDTVPTCDSDFPALVDPSALDFTNPTRIDSAEAETTPVHHGALVYVPEGSSLCGDDVALVMAAETVDVPFATLRLDEAPVDGEAYTAVGYGMLGELIGGEGTRRARNRLHFVCSVRGCAPTLSNGEALGEDGPCEGDSGGPALDEQGKAVGILSRGTASCETPIYETLFAHRAWLREVVSEAASVGDYSLPAWALPPQAGGLGGAGTSTAGFGGEAGGDTTVHGPGGARGADDDSPTDPGCSCSWAENMNGGGSHAISISAMLVAALFRRRLSGKMNHSRSAHS